MEESLAIFPPHTKTMDPSNLHFISLISPSRGGQTTPLPPGIGGALSPMVIPLATRADDAISSAYGGGQHTISMIPTTAGPMMLTQPHALPPDLPVSAPAAVQPQVPSVNLYKCVTGASSDGMVCRVYMCVCTMHDDSWSKPAFVQFGIYLCCSSFPPPSLPSLLLTSPTQKCHVKPASATRRKPLWTCSRRPTLTSTRGRSKTHSARSCPTFLVLTVLLVSSTNLLLL